jgi:hypothetical protein
LPVSGRWIESCGVRLENPLDVFDLGAPLALRDLEVVTD